MESPSSVFSAWDAYYTVAGTSASALTGLTFVIITLLQGAEHRSNIDGVKTFSTPTVVHFTAALMISGLLCAPWPALTWPAGLLAIIGLTGVSYQCRILLLSTRVGSYKPDLEDWLWYSILPMVAYATVFGGAVGLMVAPAVAAYAPAAGVALLILVGIHNSWDVVTFIATRQFDTPEEEK